MDGYGLLDAADGRRLERFGDRIVDRPAPGPRAAGASVQDTGGAGAGVARTATGPWLGADLRFDPGFGWSGRDEALEPWVVEVAGLAMELRPMSSGGVGLYPEHLANVDWLEDVVRAKAAGSEDPPMVLNLFAHTGLATLTAARAGAAVVHVDAARSAVAWARRNAERNGLADRPIRWLVDDAAAFVAREARRGRRYDGVILDPPSLGRSERQQWRLWDDLSSLLEACREIATDAFLLLTAHTAGLTGQQLRDHAVRAFAPGPANRVAVEPLTLVANSGSHLAAGWAVRLPALTHGRGRRR